MIPTPSQLLRSARASVHGALGTVCFRLGRLGAARRQFHRVLELRGDDFRAYLTLSRIACAQGDYRGWRRESEHARRMAPQRFERLRHRWALLAPHTAGALMYEAGERATWRPSPAPRPHSGPLGSGGFGAGSGPGLAGPGLAGLGHGYGSRSRASDDSWTSREEEDALAEALEWFDRMDTTDRGTDSASEGAIERWNPDPPCHRSRRFGDDFSSEQERQRFSAETPISRAEIAANDLDELARRLGAD